MFPKQNNAITLKIVGICFTTSLLFLCYPLGKFAWHCIAYSESDFSISPLAEINDYYLGRMEDFCGKATCLSKYVIQLVLLCLIQLPNLWVKVFFFFASHGGGHLNG